MRYTLILFFCMLISGVWLYGSEEHCIRFANGKRCTVSTIPVEQKNIDGESEVVAQAYKKFNVLLSAKEKREQKDRLKKERMAFEAVSQKKQYGYIHAKYKNKVVGYLCYVYQPASVYIQTLAILPKYQRRGIGSTMLNFLCKKLQTRGGGITSVCTAIPSVDKATIAFLRNHYFMSGGKDLAGIKVRPGMHLLCSRTIVNHEESCVSEAFDQKDMLDPDDEDALHEDLPEQLPLLGQMGMGRNFFMVSGWGDTAFLQQQAFLLEQCRSRRPPRHLDDYFDY